VQNLEYLDGYGSFLAECGPPEEAVAVLRCAVQLQPEEGFEKFM
jgi:kinesin family protein 5